MIYNPPEEHKKIHVALAGEEISPSSDDEKIPHIASLIKKRSSTGK